MEKVHLICNAHLDPVWLWEWEEGAAEALSTFRTAADFCEEYEGFIFNHNEALLYKWIEEYDPGLFRRIQGLVEKGKWHIMGGWFLQPDCNMPAGESIIRQILHGRKYFRSRFGKEPETALNFDSFGHSRGLVQILEKTGYDSYMVCRPGCARDEIKGNDFIWTGYDNSRVIVHISDENYNSIKGKAAVELTEWIEKHKNEKTGLFLWGIGNHGGGPSREDLDNITALMRAKGGPEIIHSVPESYFNIISNAKGALESFDKPLAPESEGCYTSQIRVKQKHRELENNIYLCEKMLSNAAAQNFLDYPRKELDDALMALLTAEFHDALPGSAIKPVEEATLRQLNYGLEIISRLRAKAFFALAAGQKKVASGETPILVYNPHPYKVNTVIECELVLPQQNWGGEFTEPLVYAGEKKIECQAEQELSNFKMDWRKRAVFRAELEPSSMNRFDCKFRVLEAKPPVELKAENGIFHFQTEKIIVEISCATGLIDKYSVEGTDYIKPGAFRPVVMNDEYNSWGVGFKNFNDTAGSFSLLRGKEVSEFSGLPENELEPVRVIEDGEVRTVVEALFSYRNSFICQRYKLPKKGTEIEVETRVYWLEKDKLLKLSIPTCLTDAQYYGQTIFGSEKMQSNGSEVVSQKWSGVFSNSQDRAVTLVNNGTHGSNCLNGEFRVSLLRSAGYATSDFHGRLAMDPNRLTDRMDQGERIYKFWLNAGKSEDRRNNIDREAQLHNEEPYALSYCPPGEGKLPGRLIELDNAAIILAALKRSEYHDTYIIRLQNPMAEEKKTKLLIPFKGISREFVFESFEVKTLELDLEKESIEEINMLEDTVAVRAKA